MTPAFRKRLIQIGLLVLIQAAALFLISGRWDWGAGWAYIGSYLAFIAVNAAWMLPRGTELAEERAEIKEGAKGWDKILGAFMSVFGPGILVVAALDERFDWSPETGFGVRAAAFVILAASYGLFAWAMASNKFFSSIVRIQKDRGHVVISSGPYRFVHHPAYIGQVISSLAIPLLLGSQWALIPVGLLIVVVVIRTALEDRTLQNELEGYKDYAARVRFRLLPGMW